MRIGFLVNGIETERARYATTVLANEAHQRGHEVCYLTLEGFTHRPDDELVVAARRVRKKKFEDYQEFFDAMTGEKAKTEQLAISELDVLMLRNDPAAELEERPWAENVGIVFGQEAVRRGVLVLNDPNGLAKALNKFYFQLFPAAVRPKTLISRDPDEIKAFAEEHRGKTVLKPLKGSGGQGVFLLRASDEPNLNQIIETLRGSGYIVAQEYLPAASEGDVRMFLLNGRPLELEGKIAAFRRRRAEDDIRSNMHVGGTAEVAEPTAGQLRAAELVRPRLEKDGMFLVGLDLAGDKLLEVNVFSPGGLYSAQKLHKARFAAAVIEAIERKVECKRDDPGTFSNAQLAVL